MINQFLKTTMKKVLFRVAVQGFQQNKILPLLSLQREMCASHLRGAGLVLDVPMSGTAQAGTAGDHWPHS